MAATIACRRCGRPIEADAEVCPHCRTVKPTAGATPLVVCRNCGYYGAAAKESKGSVAVGCALLFFFIIPGVIYGIWALSANVIKCPQCGNQHPVPVGSPQGRRLLAEMRNRAQGKTQLGGAPDLATQLERLAELRNQGVLTVDEFEQQKAKLLD